MFQPKKTAFFFLFIFLCCGQLFAKDTYVKPYTRANGSHVNGYYRTSPNKTVFDNYSTQGNTNPYTGKQGNVNPYTQQRSNDSFKSYNENKNFGWDTQDDGSDE
jgi:hypothetical protein